MLNKNGGLYIPPLAYAFLVLFVGIIILSQIETTSDFVFNVLEIIFS
ncbi:MAG: hypothetical protein ACOCRX_01580 [Candidatus Woesearchaeota archaeon]